MIDRQMYTVREFCERNSIGRTKFFELVKANAFRVVRLDGRLMIPASAEAQWRDSLPVVMEGRNEALQTLR